MSKFPVVRRCDRAAAVAAAIVQILETAPANERLAAIETYLRDEFLDAQRQTFADYAHCRGDGNA